MPSDLIYREDAKDYARHAIAKGLNVLEYLDEVPAADFRPVVHGKWAEHVHNLYDGKIGYSIECTACHDMFTEVDLGEKPSKPKFCPNCGADMREES